MFNWFRRIFLTATLLTLLITNVLTLSSTGFNALLSGAIATVTGIQSVSSRLQSRLKQQTAMTTQLQATLQRQKTHVRALGQNFTARTKRITAYSIAGIPAAMIPFAGLALLVAGTVWELNQLCEGLKELETLYRDLDIDESIEQDTLQAVCHPRLSFGRQQVDPGESE